MAQAGKFRHRLQIQKPTSAQGPTGQDDDSTSSYATIATVWAEVKPKSITETVGEGIARAVKKYDIMIRWTSDIQNDYRLIFETKTLNIETVVDIDVRNRVIRLTASEQL